MNIPFNHGRYVTCLILVGKMDAIFALLHREGACSELCFQHPAHSQLYRFLYILLLSDSPIYLYLSRVTLHCSFILTSHFCTVVG